MIAVVVIVVSVSVAFVVVVVVLVVVLIVVVVIVAVVIVVAVIAAVCSYGGEASDLGSAAEAAGLQIRRPREGSGVGGRCDSGVRPPG